MARVLITGMSGTGKSTVLEILRQRGHQVVETDEGTWKLPDETWDEARIDELLQGHSELVVSGTVENQAKFYDKFDDVVLLSVPLEVALQRVKNRTNNPYGQTDEQQREITEYFYTVEPLLRSSATIELDGCAPAEDLADVLERLVDDGLDFPLE
ncbi:AAA family ATPase [Arthrobacter pigmenti]